MRWSFFAGVSVLSGAFLWSGSSQAYSTASVVSDGCHEAITFSAVRGVRNELATAGPIAPSNDDEKALLEDVPFSVPSDMYEIGSVTAVLGNRNVDLKDHEPDDLEYLSQVHGDPANQMQHCLRAPSDDDPGGDVLALVACRGYIRGRALAALDGLDAAGMPDPSLRSQADVYLELRGVVEASLPTYWWEIGRALHTVQDGFSHTYRSQEDPRLVIAVLNYAEEVEGKREGFPDGPAHSSTLDECVDLDGLRKQRIQLAVDASADLLRATLDPALDRAGKEAAVEAMLDRYLSFREGCTADNGWCDAPEAEYEEQRGCVCSLGTRGSGGGGAALAGLAFVVLALRRKRPGRGVLAVLAGAAGAAVLLVPAMASAQEKSGEVVVQEVEADEASLPEGAVVRVDRTDPFPFGAHVAGGASVANPAAAVSLGLRYRLSSQWLIGVDGEYNPFYARATEELRPGVTNVYATGVLRFPMTFESMNLRSTLSLGISRMNMDLYGVPKGSIGPFIGFNLLGVDFELTRQVYLVVNPAFIAIPIPQTEGVPYSYPQYRISIGFQVGA